MCPSVFNQLTFLYSKQSQHQDEPQVNHTFIALPNYPDPYPSTMAKKQRVRFALPEDRKLESSAAYVSLTDPKNPAPARPTPAEEALHEEDADVDNPDDGSVSNSDPPASLLDSAPLYVPPTEEDETFGWWGPPSFETSPVTVEQTEPEPSKRRRSWLPTLRQLVNLFAGRRRDATISRLHSLSAPAAGTAGPSTTANRQDDFPCPTDPIWILGQEPDWRDEWDADYLWGGIYPAPLHPDIGYAWVEPDVFEPEIVQRGFHVPLR